MLKPRAVSHEPAFAGALSSSLDPKGETTTPRPRGPIPFSLTHNPYESTRPSTSSGVIGRITGRDHGRLNSRQTHKEDRKNLQVPQGLSSRGASEGNVPRAATSVPAAEEVQLGPYLQDLLSRFTSVLSSASEGFSPEVHSPVLLPGSKPNPPWENTPSKASDGHSSSQRATSPERMKGGEAVNWVVNSGPLLRHAHLPELKPVEADGSAGCDENEEAGKEPGGLQIGGHAQSDKAGVGVKAVDDNAVETPSRVFMGMPLPPLRAQSVGKNLFSDDPMMLDFLKSMGSLGTCGELLCGLPVVMEAEPGACEALPAGAHDGGMSQRPGAEQQEQTACQGAPGTAGSKHCSSDRGEDQGGPCAAGEERQAQGDPLFVDSGEAEGGTTRCDGCGDQPPLLLISPLPTPSPLHLQLIGESPHRRSQSDIPTPSSSGRRLEYDQAGAHCFLEEGVPQGDPLLLRGTVSGNWAAAMGAGGAESTPDIALTAAAAAAAAASAPAGAAAAFSNGVSLEASQADRHGHQRTPSRTGMGSMGPDTMQQLREHAMKLVAMGCGGLVSAKYRAVRGLWLGRSVSKLAVVPLDGPDAVGRLPWEGGLQPVVAKWLRDTPFLVSGLYLPEKRLCSQVLGGLGIRSQDVLAAVLRDSQLTATLETLRVNGLAIVRAPPLPERLFMLIDMFSYIQSLLPTIEELYGLRTGDSAEQQQQEQKESGAWHALLAALPRAIFATVDDLYTTLYTNSGHNHSMFALSSLSQKIGKRFSWRRSRVGGEPSGSVEPEEEADAAAGPTSADPLHVHPLASYVCNYVQQFYDSSSRRGQAIEKIYRAYGEVRRGEGRRTVVGDAVRLLEGLSGKLASRAKRTWPGSGMGASTKRALFLINNSHYILQTVRKLQLPTVSTHQTALDGHLIAFQEACITKVLATLHPPLPPPLHTEEAELEARVKAFNVAFEELALQQRSWAFISVDCRRLVRAGVATRLKDAYIKFLGDHSDQDLRWNPDSLERLVLKNFFLFRAA